MNRPRFWFLVTLILLAAASRLVPHPPNITPLAAVALFGGATIERRGSAFLVPPGGTAPERPAPARDLPGGQPNRGFYQGQ